MDQSSAIFSFVSIGLLVAFVAFAFVSSKKRGERLGERARQAASALGLEYIEGIEAFRSYYFDSGQAAFLEQMQRLPEPIRRIMSSGHWWRLSGKRGDIRLAVSVEGRGKNQTPYTVVRAFYPREFGFELRIWREGIMAKIGKTVFGLQDIEIGNPEFDPYLRVKASDPTAAQLLLSPFETRSALLSAVASHPAFVADRRCVSWEKAGIHLEAAELGVALDSLAAVARALSRAS